MIILLFRFYLKTSIEGIEGWQEETDDSVPITFNNGKVVVECRGLEN